MRGCGRYWHCCPRGCVRRQHGQRLPEKSADLQLLCRFYFLISNLRQPPHNNMADPAYGTGATQLETRPPEVQLLRAGQGDEKGRTPPGWRWRSVRMWRRGRKKRRRAQRRSINGRRKGGLAPWVVGFSVKLDSPAPCRWRRGTAVEVVA